MQSQIQLQQKINRIEELARQLFLCEQRIKEINESVASRIGNQICLLSAEITSELVLRERAVQAACSEPEVISLRGELTIQEYRLSEIKVEVEKVRLELLTELLVGYASSLPAETLFHGMIASLEKPH